MESLFSSKVGYKNAIVKKKVIIYYNLWGKIIKVNIYIYILNELIWIHTMWICNDAHNNTEISNNSNYGRLLRGIWLQNR